MTELLQQGLQFITGVGPKRAALLATELGLHTLEDLIHYYPYKYIDRTRFYKIKEVSSSLSYVQLRGIVSTIRTVGEGRQKRLIAELKDDTGSIELVWFKGVEWTAKNLPQGQVVIVYGKPSLFGGRMNMVHPEIELEKKSTQKIETSMRAVYHTTEKMKARFVNSKVLGGIIENVMKMVKGKFTETLPAYLLKEQHLLRLNETIFNIHFPQSNELLRKAEYRLKFEELFYIQLGIVKQKAKQKQEFQGHIFSEVGSYFNAFYQQKLPFDLTGAQKKVLREIRKDVATGKQMNRLLQGDVGSGKTLVALMSMLLAIDNGCQACMMAPTEILANQHLETLTEFLEGMPLQIALLTGSTKKKERNLLHEQLQNGTIHILVGTHALLEDVVQFQNLGLMVIDEQHRFGVAQRAKLWRKNYIPPHVLVMSATPIPRTLAMTVYGDLDVSIIDELPPGRKPIETIHVFENKRGSIYKSLKKQLALGRQVYIVFPMIQESEKFDYQNLEEGYERLLEVFPPENYRIGMVHGKMKAEEKEAAMSDFAQGKIQILVATTVIEVGVNVPNASVMVIESAERFGLSQLHQLRGRVGRGAEQSYCILVTSFKLSHEGRTRLETMVRTQDGFEVAEVDMKLRGPGDIEGTQQSGVPFDLKIANLVKDSPLMQHTRDVAMKIIQQDEDLEHKDNYVLLKQLRKNRGGAISWNMIS